ncbi:MAG: Phosphatidylglycerol/phosphatidylinositol transfer protein [Chaenotheca gracillima]|nr:MAG: Phosphatidylglycerol/phosphatidylinositol transfer protein [Chaenotheca gracillima]
MGLPVCNTTLTDQRSEQETKPPGLARLILLTRDVIVNENPLLHGLTFHQLGLIISVISTLFATAVSLVLIVLHATHYAQPMEQRHIIRILFMIPIYSIVSFLSFLYYRHAVYFQVIRDCYEAIAIASFFSLLCYYIGPTLHDQKDFFRALPVRGWILPISWFKRCCGGDRGIWRTPRSGLTWFNIVWLGVYQYCFVRVFFTLISLVTQVAGVYCEESISPAFAHVWVMVFEAASVTVAMYCLVQYYIQLKSELAPHKPGLKIACIKLVIFLSFWQTLMISFLTSAKTNLVKPSDSVDYADLTVGIPSILLCVEMALFAILHIWAFPFKGYHKNNVSAVSEFYDGAPGYQGGFLGVRAYMDAFNPWDLVKAVGRGFRWLVVGRRKRLDDSSYKNHVEGVGMEPRRSGTGFAPNGRFSGQTISAPKPGRYQRLDEDDDQELLHHAQSNPTNAGAEPYIGRHPTLNRPLNESGDIGDAPSGPERYNQGLESGHFRPVQGATYGELPSSESLVEAHLPPVSQDTGYHGAAPSPAPVIPQGGADWDLWGGARPPRGDEPPGPHGRPI